MSELKQFFNADDSRYRLKTSDKILAIAWYLEAKAKKQSFGTAALRSCFRELSIDPPANLARDLQRLANQRPAPLIVQGQAYKLSGETRNKLDRKYGDDVVVTSVTAALADLPAKMPAAAEKTFLNEALSCYRVQAYRAAIIMAWNLAFDHLINWILADTDRLTAFNAAVSQAKGKNARLVTKLDGFDEFKEFDVIEFIRAARILDKNTCQILKEKLGKRNAAAHPSRVVVTQHQANDVITDLVNNVILPLV